jgi:hypothetical protein
MIRRRRSVRETPFSLDSFLDLVTNVVGIIIRLILVAWVAARSYTSLPEYLKKAEPSTADVGQPSPTDDPLTAEIARQKHELAEAEARLLEQLRQVDLLQHDRLQAEKDEATVKAGRDELAKTRAELDAARKEADKAKRAVTLSLDDLEQRRQKLMKELVGLEKQPSPSKLLRYRTPVSQTVHGGESHFECQGGKVAHVDLEAMIGQIQRSLRDKEMDLRNQWEISEVTEPIGAFRMRYMVQRRRGNADALFPGGGPDAYSNFSYGVSEWRIEPIDPARGETVDVALAERSEFRHVIDALAVERAAVTFWVYPDSFAAYRQLRDYAADRGLTVAGRPLPDGTPISGAPWGKKSRGQ